IGSTMFGVSQDDSQSIDELVPSPKRIVLPSKLRRMGRALKYRNYRLFFYGQGISLIGTWINRLAIQWLVYALTRDEGMARAAVLMGTVAFAEQIPTFLLSSFTGVLADRWPRRRILMITQVLFMLLSFTLAILDFTGLITVGLVLVI